MNPELPNDTDCSIFSAQEVPEPVQRIWEQHRCRPGQLCPNNAPDRFRVASSHFDLGSEAVVAVSPSSEPSVCVCARRRDGTTQLHLGFVRSNIPIGRELLIVRNGVLNEDRGASRSTVELLSEIGKAAGVSRVVLTCVPEEIASELCREHRSVIAGPVEQRFLLSSGDGPDVRDELSGSASKKSRKYLRKLERESDDIEVRRVATEEDVEPFCRAADRISEHSYHQQIAYGVRDTPAWREMIRCDAAAGRLESYLLLRNGEPLAYSYALFEDGVLFREAQCIDRQYERYSLGTVLFSVSVGRITDVRGPIRCIDFGHGKSEFKARFSNTTVNEQTVTIWTHGSVVPRVIVWSVSRLNSLARSLSSGPVGRMVRRRIVRSASPDRA